MLYFGLCSFKRGESSSRGREPDLGDIDRYDKLLAEDSLLLLELRNLIGIRSGTSNTLLTTGG